VRECESERERQIEREKMKGKIGRDTGLPAVNEHERVYRLWKGGGREKEREGGRKRERGKEIERERARERKRERERERERESEVYWRVCA